MQTGLSTLACQCFNRVHGMQINDAGIDYSDIDMRGVFCNVRDELVPGGAGTLGQIQSGLDPGRDLNASKSDSTKLCSMFEPLLKANTLRIPYIDVYDDLKRFSDNELIHKYLFS